MLDLDNGLLRFINARHHPAVHLRDGSTAHLYGGGRPLGMFPDSEYTTHVCEMSPGDLLAFYTDGVIEAENADGE